MRSLLVLWSQRATLFEWGRSPARRRSIAICLAVATHGVLFGALFSTRRDGQERVDHVIELYLSRPMAEPGRASGGDLSADLASLAERGPDDVAPDGFGDLDAMLYDAEAPPRAAAFVSVREARLNPGEGSSRLDFGATASSLSRPDGWSGDDQIGRQVSACLGDETLSGVSLIVDFTAAGSLAGPPAAVRKEGRAPSPERSRAELVAARAVAACAPYRISTAGSLRLDF